MWMNRRTASLAVLVTLVIILAVGVPAHGLDRNNPFPTPLKSELGLNPLYVTSAEMDDILGPDLIITSASSDSISIFYNRMGTIDDFILREMGQKPAALVTGKFNSGSKLDIAAVNKDSNQVTVLNTAGSSDLLVNGFPRTYTVGNKPVAIAAADFNMDNCTDLVTANSGSNNVSVLFNQGDGTFRSNPIDVTVGTAPSAVVARDVNGDGRPDIVAANEGSNNVSVLINLSGRFNAAVNYPVGGLKPRSIAAEDLTGDFLPEIVVSDSMSNEISVLRNAAGSFQAPVKYGVGTKPVGVAAGDFNGDGKNDVAVVNELSNNTTVLLNSGNGVLQRLGNYPVGRGPCNIVTVDFNRDTKTDLVVANTLSHDITVLLNQGSSFKEVRYNNGPYIMDMKAADFNGDRKPDLAVTGSGKLFVLTNGGNGKFTQSTTLSSVYSPSLMVTGDFNRDGFDDLAQLSKQESVEVFLTRGKGVFGPPTNYKTGMQPKEMIPGDFNGDGRLDLVVANTLLLSEDLTFLFNNGTGGFSTVNSNYITEYPVKLASDDFNADGKLDLAVSTSNGNLIVLNNNGNGTFSTTSYQLGSNPSKIITGDYNKDGKKDLACIGWGYTYLLINNGNRTFENAVKYEVGTNPTDIINADVNRDGKMDLVVLNYKNIPSDISVLVNNGDGTFLPAEYYQVGITPTKLIAADYNGDNMVDIAVSSRYSGKIMVLNNDGTGVFNPGVEVASGEVPIVGQDLNSDGKPDLAVVKRLLGEVTVLINGGVRPAPPPQPGVKLPKVPVRRVQ